MADKQELTEKQQEQRGDRLSNAITWILIIILLISLLYYQATAEKHIECTADMADEFVEKMCSKGYKYTGTEWTMECQKTPLVEPKYPMVTP